MKPLDRLKSIQMLPPDEIIARLTARKKRNDDHDMRLYRCIAKRMVGTKNAAGVIMVLDWAIRDHMDAGGYPPFMATILFSRISDWIEILIDDEEVKAQALEEFEAANFA